MIFTSLLISFVCLCAAYSHFIFVKMKKKKLIQVDSCWFLLMCRTEYNSKFFLFSHLNMFHIILNIVWNNFSKNAKLHPLKRLIYTAVTPSVNHQAWDFLRMELSRLNNLFQTLLKYLWNISGCLNSKIQIVCNPAHQLESTCILVAFWLRGLFENKNKGRRKGKTLAIFWRSFFFFTKL